MMGLLQTAQLLFPSPQTVVHFHLVFFYLHFHVFFLCDEISQGCSSASEELYFSKQDVQGYSGVLCQQSFEVYCSINHDAQQPLRQHVLNPCCGEVFFIFLDDPIFSHLLSSVFPFVF